MNDTVNYDLRQKLIPLIPYLPGTMGDGLNDARKEMALDWFVGDYTNTWLEVADRTQDAWELLRTAGPAMAGPIMAGISSAGISYAVGAIAASSGRFMYGPAMRVDPQLSSSADHAARAAIKSVAFKDRASTNPTVTHLQMSLIDLYTRMVMVGRRIEKIDVINHVGELVTA